MNGPHAAPARPAPGYAETYARWRDDPDGYWLELAKGIDWIRPPERAFDPAAGVYGRWFPDATCNTAFNALDRHVRDGRGEQAALIYDSPVTGTKARYSYAEMLDEVATLAAVLQDLGVAKGDRVIIYMPMVPEAVFAMLASARIGAVHSVVFGGFAAKELATRIDDAAPKVILTASCGIEPARVVEYKPLLDGAIAMAGHKPQACVVLARPQAQAAMQAGRDQDWRALTDAARAAGRKADCVELKATDPLYILYTSGTTGRPKGVVRDNGGHMVVLKATMDQLYGVGPGEVMFTASDVGWVVGHSYIVYAPLIQGATTVLYEGKPVGTPDPSAFWRVIAEHGVKVLFTAPTAFRAIRKEDPEGRYLAGHDLSGFKALFLAGERADPETLKWAEALLEVPVIDHWWQTESGSPIVGDPMGLGLLPVKHGSPTVPLPGWDVQCLDEGGRAVEPGHMGAIVLKLPLPPGALTTLWQDDARFREGYLATYPGYYNTSDAGFIDEDGYVFIMGRTDDIINVAGHRLSTGGMEEVLAAHPAVAECAVVGIRDALKGEQPCGFVVLKAGATHSPEEVERELIVLVRERIGPVAAFKLALTVARLPKTRSGKILRATMKKIADGEDYTVPATIEDITVLGEIGIALKGRGIG
ncbi:propionyl-CoA synthetase [Bosea sp. (in: a-proteobacteria)]|uniref:propionyl-CoA synthetase n=1 Tax=Bosea sp. (in: a-proteobacteria) TaxID=1871050 RepID=UPI00261FB3A6|nr:propionyl-CoA synthetase [Bosea sp. (in: a-proteobacteria)]MCO5091483.1 propionyl-CoA synthetase [Bosea sp. (in: a-proteobacteria)]